MRESDVDGDAAAFFFFQTIGVNASQRLDQRGLSVVDMPGSANDDRFHSEMMILAVALPNS